MRLRRTAFAAALFVSQFALAAEAPPEPLREFRGAWVASVYNLDWPSRSGLTVAQQQAELRSLLDRAAALRLNAIVFQVRPQCDALYASEREPWSPFLTGAMGRAPEPFYDPLEFAVAEAHARGLELHAWFNPFRALANAKSAASSNHVTKRHPDWIRRYGTGLWLDPGEPAARADSLAVILDVVRRYDIDGVHIDDYFYPYPTKDRAPFPDDKPWSRYRLGGGTLSRDDWRRENINDFVAKLHRGIKAEKPWVKFGISPFGIWRPRVPETIQAELDAFAHIYADSRRWLNSGWCDYFSPQLYWGIEPAKQSFPVLLKWWHSQNTERRHVWPGIATDRVGPDRTASEIANQIVLTKGSVPSSGHIHWSISSVLRNRGGVADLLKGSVYREFALVPASPWLGGAAIAKPTPVRAEGRIRWTPQEAAVRWWLVQIRRGNAWTARLLAANQTSIDADESADAVAIRGIDRAGVAGEAGVIELR